MRIVIQNSTDMAYLAAPGRWTFESREAMVFDSFRMAVAFCSRHKLGAVQIVLQADGESECADWAASLAASRAGSSGRATPFLQA